MIELSESLFRSLEKAVWLLNEKQEILLKSRAAESLEQNYKICLKTIIEISQGQGCILHSTKTECLNCPLERRVSPLGFPFILLSKTGKEVEFWGRVDQKEQQILLQIVPQTNTKPKDYLMFNYLNDVREVERKKIAQDLHDGIAQSIYSLMLETRGLKWLTGAEQNQKLKEIDRHFSEVLQEVKHLAGELRPMSLDEFGLIQGLEQFIARTNEMTGFEIEMRVLGEVRPLLEAQRTAIYRIIQEAVANALKYAGINTVFLTLDYHKELLVTIHDEGQGFDLTSGERGFGLLNMKERAHAISSNLTIYSKPDEGTTITMSVPLKGDIK